MKHCKLCKQLLHYPEPPEVHVGMRFTNGAGKLDSSYTIFEVFSVKGSLHIQARRDRVTLASSLHGEGEAETNPAGRVVYFRFREGQWESISLKPSTGNYLLQWTTQLHLGVIRNRDYS